MAEASPSAESTSSSDACPRCGGSGWIILEREGISGAERCECADIGLSDRVERAAGIPSKFEHVSLANFVVPDNNPIARDTLGQVSLLLKAYVREYPFCKPQGLLFVGDTGCGKTHLAVSVLRALIANGHQGLFFDYQTLLNRIRSSYNADSGTGDREAYRASMDADILVLDDLGDHRVKDWVEDIISSIVNHRYNNNKTLIATTNLQLQKPESSRRKNSETSTVDYKRTLGEVIGVRAQSRLYEMCRIVDLSGIGDYRELNQKTTKRS